LIEQSFAAANDARLKHETAGNERQSYNAGENRLTGMGNP
jgi:hypothetical protein